jgi:tetratricopeptide (TPR) repeat protein
MQSLATLALAQALRLSDELKKMASDDGKRLTLLMTRAVSLGSLAQDDYAGESPERQGRLRAVALTAAVTAYKDALDGIPWAPVAQSSVRGDGSHPRTWTTMSWTNSNSGTYKKEQILYEYALLLQQHSEYEKASSAYKEAISTTQEEDPRFLALSQFGLHYALARVAEASQDPSQQPVLLAELQRSFDIVDCPDGWGERVEVVDGKLCNERVRKILGEQIKAISPESWTKLEQRRQERERQRAIVAAVNQDWEPVETAADEIAQKMWWVQYAQSQEPQMSPARRTLTERAIQGTNAHIADLVQEQFCPAKKVMVAGAGGTEFTKRAADHCKNHPPTGSAQGNYYGGAESGEVTLTSQCQAALASRCP